MKLNDIKETEFPLKPQGVYECVVAHVEKRDGPKGPYFNWQYEIAKGPQSGGKLFDVTSLTPNSLWKLKKVLSAILGDTPALNDLLNTDTDSEEFAREIQFCIEKRCKVYIEHKTNNKGKVVEDVQEIYPVENTPTNGGIPEVNVDELPF